MELLHGPHQLYNCAINFAKLSIIYKPHKVEYWFYHTILLEIVKPDYLFFKRQVAAFHMPL